MDPLRFMMRAKRLVQNPPSMTRVLIGLGAVAICVILFGIEYFVGWPDWLTLEPIRPNRPLQ